MALLKLEIRMITYQTKEYEAEITLRNEILRVPIGLDIATEDLSSENNVTHVGAFLDGVLVGTLYVKQIDAQTFRIKQVAVRESCQGQQIGYQMLAFAQTFAMEQGAQMLILDSRLSAVGFYEKFGFVNTKKQVFYFDIPHLHMKKALEN